MMRFIKSAIPFVVAVFIIGGAFIGGVFVGHEKRPATEKITSLFNKESEVIFDTPETDFSSFWNAWNAISEKYVSANGTSTAVTDQEKVWGAIEGLVGSLGDPYSVFLPPADSETFEENISGNFGGVGIEIGIRDDILTVISPLKDTPAYNAGILAGDKIIQVDDTTTIRASIEEAVRLIRGEVGTPVLLTVIREDEDEPLEIEVIRGIISIPTIDTEDREDGIFVIKLYNFSATSPNLFRDALRDFVLSGSNKLIFDLRGNAGGFLQAAVEISSWFLPAGKIVVTEDYGDYSEDLLHRSKGYNIFNDNLEMVILVNGGSASAAEIVAGALSQHGVGRLVGSTTFGKGSVQELDKTIAPGTSLKITVAHWRTPDGSSISKGGLMPEIEVEMTREDREAGIDPQLDKAVEILLNS